MRKTLLFAALLLLPLACIRRAKTEDTPEDVLAQMRADTAWIRTLDSLILVSFYAGFQVFTPEEAIELTISNLDECGFTVQEQKEEAQVLTLLARSAEGINYFGRHLLRSDEGVEFSVSVQYPDENAEDAEKVVEMARRYPAGPNGLIFVGEALK